MEDVVTQARRCKPALLPAHVAVDVQSWPPAALHKPLSKHLVPVCVLFRKFTEQTAKDEAALRGTPKVETYTSR